MPPRVSVIRHCKPAEKSTFKRLVIAHAHANANAKAKAKANASAGAKRASLTHPDSGAQAGTRLQRSLMTRITMTADFRSLTFACEAKQ